MAANLPSQIIFKREQDRTDPLPVTYREYVYVVPPGTSEADAETLLRAQLDLVRTSLDRFPPGKLVNLAVFDAPFQGRPSVPPLATLAWKDWRGDAEIDFPRRPPPAHVEPPPAHVEPPPAHVEPPAAHVEPPPAHVEPPAAHVEPPAAHVEPPAFTPVAIDPPPQTPVLAAGPSSDPPRDVAGSAPVRADPFAPQPQAPSAAPAAAIRPPTPGRPIRPPGARVSGEDLIANLFEAMHELHFLRDAVEGGDFCLTLAMTGLPSQAGLVHLYDIDHREFVVTGARGANARDLLLRRHAESEPMLAAAMRRRQAIVADTSQESGADARDVERYAAVGGARSVIVAPVMQAGRFLGAIELLNPLDERPFTESDGNAVMYIAEQFAEFVANRGVVIDAERIAAGR